LNVRERIRDFIATLDDVLRVFPWWLFIILALLALALAVFIGWRWGLCEKCGK
jgi:type VI protein secretion system component VasF